MSDTVEKALELALEALVEVEWVTQYSDFGSTTECVWCGRARRYGHFESCARHSAIVAIHEARVEMNSVER